MISPKAFSQSIEISGWDIAGDSMVFFFPLNENVNEMQYDMNTMKFYGLGNYVVDSSLVGGYWMYDYSIVGSMPENGIPNTLYRPAQGKTGKIDQALLNEI